MKQDLARARARTPLAIASALLDDFPYPALIVSSTGLVIHANPAAYIAFHHGADILNGKSIHDPSVFGFAPGDEGSFETSVLTAALENDGNDIDAVLERKNDRRTFSVRTIPLRLGETVAYAVLYRDGSHDPDSADRAENRANAEHAREAARNKLEDSRFRERLAEISLTGLDAGTLAQRMIDEITRRFELRSCSIWLAAPDNTRLMQIAQTGFAAPISPVDMHSSADAARVFIRGGTLVRDDSSSPDVPSASRMVLDMLGAQPKSYMILPLEVASVRLGVLISIWPTPHGFSSADIDRHEDIASVVALGLHRALLDREITTQAKILEGANRILESALSAPSEEELGKTCVNVAEMLTGSQFGFIAETNGGGSLRSIAISNPGWDACELSETELVEHGFRPIGLYGHVLETGEPYYTNDPAHSHYSAGTPAGHPQLTSFLAVPLASEGQVVGVVAVANRIGGYGEEHVHVLSALAPSVQSALMRRRTNERLRRSSQLLSAHLENSPVAVVEFDARWHVVQWSREAERMFGYSAEEVLGHDYRTMPFVHEDDREHTDTVVAAFEHGKEPKSTSINRNYRKDGSVIWCEWHSSAMYDEHGELSSILSFALDITDRKIAEEAGRITLMRAILQKDLAAAIAASLDSASLAERTLGIVRAQLGALAGAVFLVDGTADRMTCVSHFGYEPSDETDAAFLRREAPGGRCIRDHAMQLSDPTDDTDHASAAFGVQGARVVAVPIIVRGVTIGVLGFAMAPGADISEDDLDLFEWTGTQLNVGFENVRLYEAEHRIAETLQETLLVGRSHVDGVAFSKAYETATLQQGHVGGDFMDVFEVQGRTVAVVMGDVSGKGIDAAVVTSLVRNAVRAHLLDGLGLREVCEKTNRVILRFTRVETFVTMFVGLLNTRSGVLRYVAAGHPEALVLSPDGECRALGVASPLLGAIEDVDFIEQRTVVARGERLVLYTDGVTEARPPGGGYFFEGAGLRQAARQHAHAPIDTIAENLMGEVMEYSQGLLKDDAAILVVEPVKLPRQPRSPQPQLQLD